MPLVTPGLGIFFGPRAIILITLKEDYQMMLHTKYQGSRPSDFRREGIFNVFAYISQCKTCDSQGGTILTIKPLFEQTC